MYTLIGTFHNTYDKSEPIYAFIDVNGAVITKTLHTPSNAKIYIEYFYQESWGYPKARLAPGFALSWKTKISSRQRKQFIKRIVKV